ncbi:FHA domain-containing protein [Corallococcus llansteffanensis]|uniref:FHA domain-containing protein n=1 Tax=Corallococcus llansteffanensis TaxID=2316731 RepID=A0A3A8PFH3_9BACT|nr:FHA domain-containing protein [Corallococcus llansteffanensis]RKH55126.1 FHA domain-containing protein [Corallococcus llansteffanensis]
MKRIRETIEVAEPLWRALEQMSHDLGVDRDALVAQALFLLARQNGYVAPTPVLLGATSAAAQSIPTEAPVAPRPPSPEPRASEPASRPVETAAAVTAPVSPPAKEPVAPEPTKAGAPADDDVAFVRNRMKQVLATVDATVLPRDVPVPSDEAESEEESDDEETSDEGEYDDNDAASEDDEESEEDEEESDNEDAPEEDEATGDIAAASAEDTEDTGETDSGDAEDEASEDSEDEKPANAEEDSEDDASIAAAVGADAVEGADEEASDDASSEDDSAEEDSAGEEDSDADASDERDQPAHGKAEDDEPEETTDSGKREVSTNITRAPQPLELFVRLAPGGPAVMVNVPRFTLGRGPNCSLTVKSGRVSREHAVIVRVGDDFFIEDLGSSNGTWINHQRIKRQKIADGDTFNLGTEAVYFSMGPRED